MTANFIADLTWGGALFSMIIIYHEARVNDSWNPAEQRQKDTEQETGDATGHEHRKWRQDHAEKISQRFHSSSLTSSSPAWPLARALGVARAERSCRAVASAEADDFCSS